MVGTASYTYSHTIGFNSTSGRGFQHPIDLAIGPNGVLYVLNRAGPEVAIRVAHKRVTMCTVDEQFLGEFGDGGKDAGKMWWAASIAIDREGNVYISDEALHRVTVFDENGRYISHWGEHGSGPGQMNRPAGIAFDNEDNLLVVDGLNHRVQRFTKNGTLIQSWGGRGDGVGEFNIPWGVAVDDPPRVVDQEAHF